MVRIFVFQVSFPDLDGCQILHGAATRCLLLPRTVKSSVGVLYGLFRIDLYALSYVRAIDVVVWQWKVNLSDSERCQTLHIAALWCLLNARALKSTARPRHGQVLPRDSPNWEAKDWALRGGPTVGSLKGGVSCQRGSPVWCTSGVRRVSRA